MSRFCVIDAQNKIVCSFLLQQDPPLPEIPDDDVRLVAHMRVPMVSEIQALIDAVKADYPK